MFEKVKAIICDQLDCKPEDVTLEASIIDDLDADSLAVIDLIMSMEDEFGVEIPDEEAESLKTVGDIVKYLEDHAE